MAKQSQTLTRYAIQNETKREVLVVPSANQIVWTPFSYGFRNEAFIAQVIDSKNMFPWAKMPASKIRTSSEACAIWAAAIDDE